MKSIATTGICPWLQLAADVISGKNGAEALLMRIRIPTKIGEKGVLGYHPLDLGVDILANLRNNRVVLRKNEYANR